MKATNQNAALGTLSPVERMYSQMLADLRSAVEDYAVKQCEDVAAANGGSLSMFVTQQNAKAAAGEDVETFELSNLYRVFAKTNPQRMSLELYVRLSGAIGIGGARMKGQKIGASNISLLDYLMIDNDVILKSFLELQYRGS